MAANLNGLGVDESLTYLLARRGLRLWSASGGGNPTVNPPRLAVVVYSTAQVFLYGLLYNTFIFADRVLAWTTDRGREDFPPYGFWLSARYELGMDLALIIVVIVGGVVEYSIRRFSEEVIPAEKQLRGSDVGPFIDSFTRRHRRHTALIAFIGAVSLVVAAIVFVALRNGSDDTLHQNLIAPTTMRVFAVAAVAYVFFMIALQNVLLLLTLSRAELAIRAVAIALAVNVGVGYALSRGVHYSAAVVGLLCGSITLMLLARASVRRVLAELDYYYYAAY
jgi:hypothetical protein